MTALSGFFSGFLQNLDASETTDAACPSCKCARIKTSIRETSSSAVSFVSRSAPVVVESSGSCLIQACRKGVDISFR